MTEEDAGHRTASKVSSWKNKKIVEVPNYQTFGQLHWNLGLDWTTSSTATTPKDHISPLKPCVTYALEMSIFSECKHFTTMMILVKATPICRSGWAKDLLSVCLSCFHFSWVIGCLYGPVHSSETKATSTTYLMYRTVHSKQFAVPFVSLLCFSSPSLMDFEGISKSPL